MAAAAPNSSTVDMQGPGSLTTQNSQSNLAAKKNATNGTSHTNSGRGRSTFKEERDLNQNHSQTNGAIITRGGNVLINEFL